MRSRRNLGILLFIIGAVCIILAGYLHNRNLTLHHGMEHTQTELDSRNRVISTDTRAPNYDADMRPAYEYENTAYLFQVAGAFAAMAGVFVILSSYYDRRDPRM